jgi:hypothetical protein
MNRSLVFGIAIAVVAPACTHAGPGVEAASRHDTAPQAKDDIVAELWRFAGAKEGLF